MTITLRDVPAVLTTFATVAEAEEWLCSVSSSRLKDCVRTPRLIRVVSKCLTPYGIDGTWYPSQLGKSSRSWEAIKLTFSSQRTVCNGHRKEGIGDWS